MAYNRYQQTSSPWASGAPPMYGNAHPTPLPPPQYGNPTYGHSSGPWNAGPQMRQNWGPTGGLPHMQHNQQRPPMRGPSGPTGKRANFGQWDGPPNKRFAGKGGRGNWRGGQRGHNNRQFNRDNNNKRNNKELNRNQTITQTERRQQHDNAQKAAESLEKKEYPLEQIANKPDSDANKNLEIDATQEKYVLAVFGYVCQICNVFLKDKSVRFEHCQSEDHLTKFNAAEEDHKKTEQKSTENDSQTKATVGESASDAVNEEAENANGEKMDSVNDNTEVSASNDGNNKKPENEINASQEEEIKENEDKDNIEDIIDETGGKGVEEGGVQTAIEHKPVESAPHSLNSYGGEFANSNRGHNFRGRGGRGGGGPRGRGRARGRGRK